MSQYGWYTMVEAHENAEGARGFVPAVIGGSVLFTLISAGLGGRTS